MENETVNLGRYVDTIRRWWWLLALGPAVAGLAAFFATATAEPVYESTTTILVRSPTAERISQPLVDIQTGQRLAATYAEIITRRPILEAVASDPQIPYSAQQLAGMIDVEVVQNTQLLEVTVRSADAEDAAYIANALAQTFIHTTRDNWLADIEQLQRAAEDYGLLSSQEVFDAQVLALHNLSDLLAELGGATITSDELMTGQIQALGGLTSALQTLSTLAEAQDLFDAQLSTLGSLSIAEPGLVPNSPVGKAVVTLVSIAIVLGLVFPVVVVVSLDYLSDKIRSTEQMEQEFHLTNLGAISRWPNGQMIADGMVVTNQPRSIYAEMFRQIRANFQFSTAAHSGKTFVLARSGSGDGNTTLVANLGAALAQDGARIVIVDGDLRRPALHERFGLPNTIGLSSLLRSDDVRIEDAVQPSSQEGLHVITSGPVPPNPAELLGSARMQTIIDALNERFDLVLFDCSPLGAVVDPVVLARKTDGVVLIAVANRTRVRDFQDGIKRLQHAGTPVIGILLNKAPVRSTDKVYGYTSTHQDRDGSA